MGKNNGPRNKPGPSRGINPSQPYRGVTGRGTAHGGKGKKSAGGGQSRPPERPCGKSMIAIPVTVIKLIFGWRPAGYQVADVPWPW